MKKICLLLILLLFAILAFSQPSSTKTMNGFVSEFRYREVNLITRIPAKWTEWTKTDVMVVYFDMGFSTIAVTNSNGSRFIIAAQVADTIIDSTKVIKFKCIDNTAVICGVSFNIHKDGVVVLAIEYSNVIIEYKMPKMEMGYPYIYFSVMEQREMDVMKNLTDSIILMRNK